MRTAVIIPALDEAESLAGLLPRLDSHHRIVVVDNGSADNTAEVAGRLGAEVVREPRRGYGSAVLAGLAHLMPQPPDVVVILDADAADNPADIESIVHPIAQDRADMVLSDRSTTSEPGALTAVQRFGNALAVTLIHRAVGHRYADMGPFRAIRWSSLMALRMEDPTWGWNVEMQLKAVHHGLRIVEIPLPYRARTLGQSKISGTLQGAFRAGTRILWAVNRYR